MEPETTNVQTPEASVAAPNIEVPKRDAANDSGAAGVEEPPAKKARLDEPSKPAQVDMRDKGIAPVKAEYRIQITPKPRPADETSPDDAAEAASHNDRDGDKKDNGKNKKKKGQNTNRSYGTSKDAKGLCSTRMFANEFAAEECQYGEKCRFEHDLRVYLKDHKREDLTTLNNICPVYEALGKCSSGWKCRMVGSHSTERETEDGKKELILLEDAERTEKARPRVANATPDGIVNLISNQDKMALMRKREDTPRADAYTTWATQVSAELEKAIHQRSTIREKGELVEPNEQAKIDLQENRAQFLEPPFMPSEKRRIYFGPETPVLAPLTTQGNMPFRRLCGDLGAQFTYSEMAMSMPLIQGSKSEWTLLKAHESEMAPPTVIPGDNIVQGYDNSKDFRFGAQIAANKPWQALKATEVLSKFTPNLRVIDLNCGCPIELVFRDGAGSALLDHHSKLEKMIRGMNTVSQEIPITVKIRMGTKDNQPTAQKLVERMVLGGYESSVLDLGPPGAAAITLHGRSRQQRYTRQADWGYISETAALIKRLNKKLDALSDTIREPDARHMPNGGKTYFIGNGDCYSHTDYDDHVNNAGVDSVMVARGALIKPWIFEEIQTGQYLDKSATERLAYIEKFVKYGLQAWGSDEHGVGTTRRFLLEWLSFTYRYVPIGLLEYLPPNIQDRAPAWRGRNELETLMGSGNYKDWIKITEMFLGPAPDTFKFEPKHKSNSYEAEG
ncbi:tRNA-dihydrouridine synthase [Penicillium expansum]|uniref:tRNA-dihydrouridine(47) synthase [NAD(P)(+)] n=1 Tax=Penicillium expansum TaxID=27334 RepID=A0A0A2JMF5_PENEN|nr:tRNA-dihydrouridine synthase [Penicillium expansum]KGO39445.1 tRNA-dihydrouridine synthase [Penicillium expansum]KGO55823.1 tRNA-dihydrouridine synthase [Penicillium expansum]KGO70635.1 tRNA-dihydrouridine synthase [Penicillium expansum]